MSFPGPVAGSSDPASATSQDASHAPPPRPSPPEQPPQEPVRLPVSPVRPGHTGGLLADSAARSAASGRSVVLRGGVPLGRPFGIPVRVSILGLLIAGLLASSTVGVAARDHGFSQRQVVALSIAGGVLLELSVLLHEIAHCVAARRLGLVVTGLKLWALGGLTEVQAETVSPRREYGVAVVGPLASLLIGGAAGAVALRIGADSSSAAALLLSWLAVVNALLAAFNLLPGLPLDGGRVLRAAVWGITGREASATKVAAIVGFAVAGVTGVTGLVLPGDATGFSRSLLALVVATYLGLNAAAALRAARLSERAPTLSAGRLARRATMAPADLPLAEALRRAGLAGATSVVVTTRDGAPQAIVSGAQVDATPAERRPWVSVSSVARPITEGLVLDAGLTGQSVLEALRSHPASEYLVVTPAVPTAATVGGRALGHLVGVLATVDVVATVDPRRLRTANAR